MSKTILFIDGENFLYKIEEVLEKKSVKFDNATRYKKRRDVIASDYKDEIVEINFNKLFESPLKGSKVTSKLFYVARLHLHPDTKKKSEELIKLQRKLRNNLVNLGYEFIIAGNVRAQKIGIKTIFREKGVDVKIAVDMVSMACDKKLDTAILCSSDSDLQPAITELKNRNIEVVYLGFEMAPNKGLTYTADRTILLRNSEILEVFNSKRRNKK